MESVEEKKIYRNTHTQKKEGKTYFPNTQCLYNKVRKLIYQSFLNRFACGKKTNLV